MKKPLMFLVAFFMLCSTSLAALTIVANSKVITVTGTNAVANTEISAARVNIVKSIRWSGTIAVGDKISFEDAKGNHICDMEAVVANQPLKEYFLDGHRFEDGIFCDDFDSGNVVIELK
jgi:hypothetical protein